MRVTYVDCDITILEGRFLRDCFGHWVFVVVHGAVGDERLSIFGRVLPGSAKSSNDGERVGSAQARRVAVGWEGQRREIPIRSLVDRVKERRMRL